MLTYLLGLQIMTTSFESTILSLCGLTSGLICYYNIFNVCALFMIPSFVSVFVEEKIGWLLESSKPNDTILTGATLDIQRQQQMEYFEQQMFTSSEMYRSRNEIYTRNDNFNNTPGSSQGYNGQIRAEEEKITTLVEMGFERTKVVEALLRTSNDLNDAMNLLLSENLSSR
jgi:ubiquitin-associated domain-containing protein 2